MKQQSETQLYGGSIINRSGAAEPTSIIVSRKGLSELQVILDFAHTMSFEVEPLAGLSIRTAIWQFIAALDAADPRSPVVINLATRQRAVGRMNSWRWGL